MCSGVLTAQGSGALEGDAEPWDLALCVQNLGTHLPAIYLTKALVDRVSYKLWAIIDLLIF